MRITFSLKSNLLNPLVTFFSGWSGGGDSAEDWEVLVSILGTPALEPLVS